MFITIFGTTRKTKEGREFTVYMSRLIKKTGEDVPVTVKFRKECGAPSLEDLPLIITVDKADANLTDKIYEDSKGNICKGHTLWVRKWEPSGERYQDASLDEFED